MPRKEIQFSNLPSTEAALEVTLLWGFHNNRWSFWEWREKRRVEKGEEFTLTEGSKPARGKRERELWWAWHDVKRV